MTTKLIFTVCLMLDIALGCAAIPVTTALGIAGAASFVTSMSRAFGVPTTQYGRHRRNYRFGKHGEEEGTFTTRMETVVYVSMCAVSRELLYLFVAVACVVLSIDFLLQSDDMWMIARIEVRRLSVLGDFRSTVSKLPGWWIPIGSMYGIYTYIWLEFMVNVGKYTIHGSYGTVSRKNKVLEVLPFTWSLTVRTLRFGWLED